MHGLGIRERLRELGVDLPAVPKPVGHYVPAVQVGDLLFTSGILPMKEGQLAFLGKLGMELTIEQGHQAARLALLNALAVVDQEIDGMDRVKRIVRMTGYVTSAPGFAHQHTVLNGASELLVAVFGDRGRHTRVAIGVAELPLNTPVELDLTVEIQARVTRAVDG